MFFCVKQYDILSTAAQHGAVKTLCGSRENSLRMCLHILHVHKVQEEVFLFRLLSPRSGLFLDF